MVRVIGVLSGKGGTGKSTLTANLALALSKKFKVSLFDLDISGPNIPLMLGLEKERLGIYNGMITPVVHPSGLKVVSLGFFMGNGDFAIWKDDTKANIISQFKNSVDWGEGNDIVLIDEAPGTDVEIIAPINMFNEYNAIVVMQPTRASLMDGERVVKLLQYKGARILGVLENMADETSRARVKDLAKKYGIPFLGSIPYDSRIRKEGEEGAPKVLLDRRNPLGRAFDKIVNRITKEIGA